MSNAYSFGQWLKQRRTSLGRTQGHIAVVINCALTTIKKIEAGERRPSFELARLLAIALDIPREHHALFVRCARGDTPITHLSHINEFSKDTLALPSKPPVQAHLTVRGDIPLINQFYGRQRETATVIGWLLEERCNVVTILGIGGQGKTALAAEVASKFAEASNTPFAHIIWYSLLNAPPLADLLQSWLGIVSDHALADVPSELDAQLTLLLYWLRQRRCLLVLDNFESILRSGGDAHKSGTYHPDYAQYSQFVQRIAQDEHVSTLLITSRERPYDLETLERATNRVRSLNLEGLDNEAARALLKEQGLTTPTDHSRTLIERYSGNPLALRLIAETIKDVYQNDVSAFLNIGTPIFDDIQDVLAQQFARLSDLEYAIVVWLALERKPVTFQLLNESLWPPVSHSRLISAIRSLRRRSLLITLDSGITLHNVVIEYTTDRVIDEVYNEFASTTPRLLASHALLRPSADEYMRHGRIQRIVRPIIARLIIYYGSMGFVEHIRTLLDRIRTHPTIAQSYAGGNLLNVLLHANVNTVNATRNVDFSRLSIRHADLRSKEVRGFNFTCSEFSDVSFTEIFGLIRSVSFSADGTLLAVGTGDAAIHVWRLHDYQSVGRLSSHTGYVESVAFAPHHMMLASGSADGTVRVWNPLDGSSYRIDLPELCTVLSVAYSKDGAAIAGACDNQQVYVWDAASGEVIHLLCGHKRRVFHVTWSPDNSTLASASEDQTVRLWNAQTGQCLHVFCGHTAAVMSVAFSPDGTRLISGGRDGLVCVWDVDTRSLIRTISASSEAVRTVAVSPDDHLIASAGEDYLVRLWDTASGDAVAVFRGHSTMVTSITFSPNGQMLASAGNDWAVRLWDVTHGVLRYVFHGYIDWILGVSISPDGRTMVSGGEDSKVSIWDLTTRTIQRQLSGHTHRVNGVAYSPKGTWFASDSDDRTVRVWSTNDLSARQPFAVLHGSRGFTRVAFNADETLLAASNNDFCVYVWDTQTWKLRHKLQHSDWVKAVAFHPCEVLLASGCQDSTISMWDAASGQHLQTLSGHTEPVRALAFHPEGTVLASGSWDGSVRLWDLASGASIATFTEHQGWIWSIAWNMQGSLLVSSGSDSAMYVRDLSSRTLLHVLHQRDTFALSVVFSPDGHLLYAGNADGTITIWDIQRGVCTDILRIERPYAAMDITGVTGLTRAQKDALKALGAIER
jgi:WD40 repeat protein/transcriptional regulator with XRE-family HTH domain